MTACEIIMIFLEVLLFRYLLKRPIPPDNGIGYVHKDK